MGKKIIIFKVVRNIFQQDTNYLKSKDVNEDSKLLLFSNECGGIQLKLFYEIF